MIYEAVIIGAGISGIALAHRLKALGKSYLILEKSRGVGGRMATRRVSDSRFDHGLPFVSLSNENHFIFSSPQLKFWYEREQKNYFSCPLGMSGLAKSLISIQDIQLNSRLSHLTFDGGTWSLFTHEQNTLQSKAVYLTCPSPQSLEILRNSHIEYAPDLESLHYSKAIVGLLSLQNNPEDFDFLQHEENVSDEILSLSNQYSKGLSPHMDISLVMSPSWSEVNFEKEELILSSQVQEAFLKWSVSRRDLKCSIKNIEIKKWRYAQAQKTYPTAFYAPPGTQKLYLLGDAFQEGGLRGALASAASTPIY